MQEFLFKYATEHGLQAHIDDKGNIYLQKGSLEKGRFFPCLVAHMDCVHQRQVSYIDANEPIPLMTEEVNGKHVIMAEGFNSDGDLCITGLANCSLQGGILCGGGNRLSGQPSRRIVMVS